MKIINETDWDTKNLKKIFLLCLNKVRKVEGRYKTAFDCPKVYIRYNRRHWWIGGYAYYHSNVMTIKLPRDANYWDMGNLYGDKKTDFSQTIAATYIHELGHNLGEKHHGGINTIEHCFMDWIKQNIGSEKYPIVKRIKVDKPKLDMRVKRYQLALNNFERAETRFKRAKTLWKKWMNKVKYYQTILPVAAEQKLKIK